MTFKNLILLGLSHAAVGIVGFAIGIFSLPLLTAPPSPQATAIESIAENSQFQTEFVRELEGSDFLHWGEGKVSLSNQHVTFVGELSPGPDFKLYLSPDFVETEQQFESLKSNMIAVGDVNTFTNFLVEVPNNVNITDYNTVIVWCESFGEFITAAKYQ